MNYIRVSQIRPTNPAFGYEAELMRFGEGPVRTIAKGLCKKTVWAAAKKEAKDRGYTVNPDFDRLKKTQF